MGIRYFAKAVTTDRIERARHDPMLSICCCPDTDSWDQPREEVPTLDLDKAWREIQNLLGLEWGGDAAGDVRPAAELVRGFSNGMDGYRRLLSPEQVDAAAADLELFFHETGRTHGAHDPYDYVEEHLEKARQFMSKVAGTGVWVYYSIG